ncbi:sugar transferase [Limobrevibacterium gyesilva]|uniref:Sugar transferase n=1 Tax=Limobrevibacterium gyesilva TaxID=2991712 RepID=A0AA41YMM4_9PROT|nr:sugar transferase [Limobrevibacterium gyesilva]MCW3474793.1 sugar transferase [Limobrevibacterium gyesilva]
MASDGRITDIARLDAYEMGTEALPMFDLVVATGALVLLVPLMILIAVAICADSGWPLFFSQTRLGRGGRPFRLYKFRKFHGSCGTNGQAVTVENDSRLTRVGRVLERAKLDELPQLWNVLKGDMAVVGPRPETPNFADCFDDSCRRVLDYKPGIFGPSQTLFRNEGSLYGGADDPEQYYRDVLFPTKARIDLAYYPSRTMWRDIGWIFRGTFAVFGGSPLSGPGANIAESVERWVQENRRETVR